MWQAVSSEQRCMAVAPAFLGHRGGQNSQGMNLIVVTSFQSSLVLERVLQY